MEKKLRLPLKKKWFDMTKSGEKTEDYREINKYWMVRLTNMTLANSDKTECSDNELYSVVTQNLDILNIVFNNFGQNIMTLGYPKSTDKDKILKLEHKGIEIRGGKEEWGAEKGKLYFVIKHGKIID